MCLIINNYREILISATAHTDTGSGALAGLVLCHLGESSEFIWVFYGWGSSGEGLRPFSALWAGVAEVLGKMSHTLGPSKLLLL